MLAPQAIADQLLSIGNGDTVTVTTAGKRVRVAAGLHRCTGDFPKTLWRAGSPAAPSPIASQLGTAATREGQGSLRAHGRTVAKIFLGSTNLHQTLVASGKAFVYWKTIQGCDRQTYGRMETVARLKGPGRGSSQFRGNIAMQRRRCLKDPLKGLLGKTYTKLIPSDYDYQQQYSRQLDTLQEKKCNKRGENRN